MPAGLPSNSWARNLARRALFDAVAETPELLLATLWRRSRDPFHIVHRRAADGAGDFLRAIHHGKQQHHAIEFITADITACERHRALLPGRSDNPICCAAHRFFLASGGSISAILRRQSASESWGPETKVPLTLVEYQPDTTPRRSDSSFLMCRGERFCIGCFRLGRSTVHRTRGMRCVGGSSQPRQPSPASRVRSASTAATRSR
jgi:hypothetical protein